MDSNSQEETEACAAKVAAVLRPGDVVGLDGDLGAGKTVFVRGIARALGIKGNIKSPTFNIVRGYDGAVPLFHFDVYRIEDESELYEIGFDDYMNKDGIVMIEWASKIEDLMPDDAYRITIERTGENSRRIVVKRGR